MEAVTPWGFDKYRRMVLPRIDSRLQSLVEDGELTPLYRYVVEGGKRLRPTLTLLISDSFGGDENMALDLACSVELTHCASLVLDDILDWDETRRGNASLHSLEGLHKAVTTGFTMPSLALNLAARYGNEYPRILTEAWVSMCMGVYREAGQAELSWETYRRTVELKTARLFATACTFGGMAAGRKDDEFGEYGLHLGRAFQMADDLADGVRNDEEIVEDLERAMANEMRRATRLAALWKPDRLELLGVLKDASNVILSLKRGENF